MSVKNPVEPLPGEIPPQLPGVIGKFVERLKKSIDSDSLSSTLKIYLYVSEKLVLPEANENAEVIGNDISFQILYKQIFDRQVHTANKSPTLEQQIRSFENYQNLFHHILEGNSFDKLKLPDQWLWDIIDEFVSQYESFCHYRENLKNKTEEEIETLKTRVILWDCLYVLEILHRLVNRAKTEIQSETEMPNNSLYKKLGHFAIYGLLRVFSLQADYYNAIKILDERRWFPAKISKIAFSSLPSCQFSVAYHAGFSYMMMQRCVDAIDIIVNTLEYYQANMGSYVEQTYQNNKIRRFVKNMLSLLCMCMVLRHVSEGTVTSCYIQNNSIKKLYKGNRCEKKIETLKENLNSQMDSPEFKICFLDVCPKFVLPKPPSLEDSREDCSMEATNTQVKVFMDEVKNHLLMPDLKFEMEMLLCEGKRKIPLMRFLKDQIEMVVEMGPEREKNRENKNRRLKRHKDVRTEGIQILLRMKHKQTQAVREENPLTSQLDCTFETTSGIDFFLDGPWVRFYGDGFFIER